MAEISRVGEVGSVWATAAACNPSGAAPAGSPRRRPFARAQRAARQAASLRLARPPQPDRERLEAAEELRADADDPGLVDLEVGRPGEQLLEQDPALHLRDVP